MESGVVVEMNCGENPYSRLSKVFAEDTGNVAEETAVSPNEDLTTSSGDLCDNSSLGPPVSPPQYFVCKTVPMCLGNFDGKSDFCIDECPLSWMVRCRKITPKHVVNSDVIILNIILKEMYEE